jgi:hypothetical protein
MPSGVDGHAAHEHVMPRYSEEFIWPVNGFGRGFTLQLTDSAGHAVTRRALHHIVIENKGRRQLMMPVSERLLAAGRETGNLMLPSSIGLPLAVGSPMKAVTMWHNETGADLKGVTLRLVIRYMPPSQMPRPLPVLPFTFDVEDKIGLPNTFDIPPGPSERSRDFVMPVDGRVLGVSGHMHDYAVALRLEDVATGKVVIRLPVRTDSVGKNSQCPHQVLWHHGRWTPVVWREALPAGRGVQQPHGDNSIRRDGASGRPAESHEDQRVARGGIPRDGLPGRARHGQGHG